MSDYSEVLYDPRTHTHTSCLKELPNCDAVVLVIGARFGGKGIPEAISQVDFEAISAASFDISLLKKKENLSVTQLEVLKAIEVGIPIYAFVDEKVLHEHHIYETNKSSGVVDQIIFPSIEKQETAKFIFEFINFLRLRARGNSVFSFSKHDDIEVTLRRQWAAHFQRLLFEQRQKVTEGRRIDNMADQFESLKAAILASIPNTDAREIARAVVRYRRLIDFLKSFDEANSTKLEQDIPFEDMMLSFGIQRIINDPRSNQGIETPMFIRDDGTFYESRMGFRSRNMESYKAEWDDFRRLSLEDKRVVIEIQGEMGSMRLVRHVQEPAAKYFDDTSEKRSTEKKTNDSNTTSEDIFDIV